MEVPTKFCRSCNIWRPPRAHHCRLCDNCVETQDHHCVWVNNCVGRRNYRYFFTFVTSTTVMGLYLIGACFAQIGIYSRREDVSFGQAANHFRIALTLIIYGVLGILYPVALTGYHLFLMGRGETTREFLNSHKLLKQDRYRAFTQGSMWRNWVVVLCRPRPPTYYRFKDATRKVISVLESDEICKQTECLRLARIWRCILYGHSKGRFLYATSRRFLDETFLTVFLSLTHTRSICTRQITAQHVFCTFLLLYTHNNRSFRSFF